MLAGDVVPPVSDGGSPAGGSAKPVGSAQHDDSLPPASPKAVAAASFWARAFRSNAIVELADKVATPDEIFLLHKRHSSSASEITTLAASGFLIGQAGHLAYCPRLLAGNGWV